MTPTLNVERLNRIRSSLIADYTIQPSTNPGEIGNYICFLAMGNLISVELELEPVTIFTFLSCVIACVYLI